MRVNVNAHSFIEFTKIHIMEVCFFCRKERSVIEFIPYHFSHAHKIAKNIFYPQKVNQYYF